MNVLIYLKGVAVSFHDVIFHIFYFPNKYGYKEN